MLCLLAHGNGALCAPSQSVQLIRITPCSVVPGTQPAEVTVVVCWRCGKDRNAVPGKIHACKAEDIEVKNARDCDVWAPVEHAGVRNRDARSAALYCGVSLENAQLELADAVVYAQRLPSDTPRSAIVDALSALAGARSVLASVLKGLPE